MTSSYQYEKLSSARSALMLPHPHGEAESIAHAFHECQLGLDHLNRDELDDYAREWVSKLENLMDTSDLSDPTKKGLWEIKAETLSVEDKFELSHVVNELAHWFFDN